jgi:hypothetical protein
VSRRLTLLPERFAICRLPADATWPSAMPTASFVSVTRTADELSLILPEDAAPADGQRSDGWRCLKLEGPFDLAETGVLAPLAAALATAGVSLLPVGTYDTDYLLLRDEALPKAMSALEQLGCVVTPAAPSAPA